MRRAYAWSRIFDGLRVRNMLRLLVKHVLVALIHSVCVRHGSALIAPIRDYILITHVAMRTPLDNIFVHRRTLRHRLSRHIVALHRVIAAQNALLAYWQGLIIHDLVAGTILTRNAGWVWWYVR